jgi:hypothetical protein
MIRRDWRLSAASGLGVCRRRQVLAGVDVSPSPCSAMDFTKTALDDCVLTSKEVGSKSGRFLAVQHRFGSG